MHKNRSVTFGREGSFLACSICTIATTAENWAANEQPYNVNEFFSPRGEVWGGRRGERYKGR